MLLTLILDIVYIVYYNTQVFITEARESWRDSVWSGYGLQPPTVQPPPPPKKKEM